MGVRRQIVAVQRDANRLSANLLASSMGCRPAQRHATAQVWQIEGGRPIAAVGRADYRK